ncbi:MAG TPA: hypothetical protein PK646_03160 [Bacillota bacterium]|jgi:hypothetical protein|nr:hypothetical protein [Fastidiosipila sp.]HPX93229.1 hypothetical protein [Bacillota bacterium]HQB81071.1 hypothetical protein [Bacillota bacterium]
MLTLEETELALADMVEALPPEIFIELNGGVLLKEEVKLHPARRADDLYILGEYYADRIFGRYIVIYYGSMRRVFGHVSDRDFHRELEQVLKHELTHHLENRAGERELEFEDQRQLLHYYARHRQNQESG